MLQRIQTLYFLMAICTSMLFGFTYNSFLPPGQFVDMAGVLSGISAGIILVAIFFYRDQLKQINFAKVARWVSLAWLALLVFLIYRDNVIESLFETGSVFKMVYLISPILFYLFVSSGLKSIRSDIELLKSADRIR